MGHLFDGICYESLQVAASVACSKLHGVAQNYQYACQDMGNIGSGNSFDSGNAADFWVTTWERSGDTVVTGQVTQTIEFPACDSSRMPGFQKYTDLSLADGSQIAMAVVAVWVIGWSISALRRVLRNDGEALD